MTGLFGLHHNNKNVEGVNTDMGTAVIGVWFGRAWLLLTYRRRIKCNIQLFCCWDFPKVTGGLCFVKPSNVPCQSQKCYRFKATCSEVSGKDCLMWEALGLLGAMTSSTEYIHLYSPCIIAYLLNFIMSVQKGENSASCHSEPVICSTLLLRNMEFQLLVNKIYLTKRMV